MSQKKKTIEDLAKELAKESTGYKLQLPNWYDGGDRDIEKTFPKLCEDYSKGEVEERVKNANKWYSETLGTSNQDTCVLRGWCELSLTYNKASLAHLIMQEDVDSIGNDGIYINKVGNTIIIEGEEEETVEEGELWQIVNYEPEGRQLIGMDDIQKKAVPTIDSDYYGNPVVDKSVTNSSYGKTYYDNKTSR